MTTVVSHLDAASDESPTLGGSRGTGAPEVNFGPESIMVVDDDPTVRRFLTRAVRSCGYPVEDTGSAEEALDRLVDGEFAVVLCDMAMPKYDGRWLLERLLEREPDLAVVMVTGNDDTATAIDCLTHGAVNYVIKPVPLAELRHVLANAIEGRRLRIENRAHRQNLERLVRERTSQLEQALSALKKANTALEDAYRETIYRLAAAIECRDAETGNHIHRMGLYSHCIAQQMGCDAKLLSLILLASPLHDIGKIGIRDSVLLKPGRLTPSEFDEMKAHTVIGARILAGSRSSLLDLAGVIALNHHERFDGTGYPRGLAGHKIPLAGRIVAVADAFDALTSKRIYRGTFSVDEALKIIDEGSRGQFDPSVVDAFMGTLDNILKIKRQYEDLDRASLQRRLPQVEAAGIHGVPEDRCTPVNLPAAILP